MGNYCSKDEYGRVLCKKCGDRFIPEYGGKSHRTSCRYHDFQKYKDGTFCETCHKNKNKRSSRNCYHQY